MQDQDPARLFHARQDRRLVERGEGAQINDLNVEALLFKLFGGIERRKDHRTKSNNRQIAAFARNSCLANLNNVIIGRYLFAQARQSIKLLMFEVKNGIRIANRSLDQTFRVISCSRLDHFQTSRVEKKRFRIERVKRSGTQARATRSTENRGDISTPAIARLRCVVRQQIKTRGNKVDKLELRNGPHSHQGSTAGGADNCAFRNRRVNHASLAKLINQPVGYFKCAPVRAHVFTYNKHSRVAFHFFPDTLADGFDKSDYAAALGAR